MTFELEQAQNSISILTKKLSLTWEEIKDILVSLKNPHEGSLVSVSVSSRRSRGHYCDMNESAENKLCRWRMYVVSYKSTHQSEKLAPTKGRQSRPSEIAAFGPWMVEEWLCWPTDHSKTNKPLKWIDRNTKLQKWNMRWHRVPWEKVGGNEKALATFTKFEISLGVMEMSSKLTYKKNEVTRWKLTTLIGISGMELAAAFA